MKNTCHISVSSQQKKKMPYGWYGPAVHHLTSLRVQKCIFKVHIFFSRACSFELISRLISQNLQCFSLITKQLQPPYQLTLIPAEQALKPWSNVNNFLWHVTHSCILFMTGNVQGASIRSENFLFVAWSCMCVHVLLAFMLCQLSKHLSPSHHMPKSSPN